jgi:hypothetical protein
MVGVVSTTSTISFLNKGGRMRDYLKEVGVLFKLVGLIFLFFTYAIVIGTPASIRC